MNKATKQRSTDQQSTVDELIAAIAKEMLHIDTLETRNSDGVVAHICIEKRLDPMPFLVRLACAAHRFGSNADR